MYKVLKEFVNYKSIVLCIGMIITLYLTFNGCCKIILRVAIKHFCVAENHLCFIICEQNHKEGDSML